MQYTFLYISLPLFCTATTWNFQKLFSYTFFGGNLIRVLVHFSSLPLIFTLHWWLLALISHFVTAATKFSCCSSNKKKNISFVFFSRWASLACHLLSSFSLSFSCSIFQICGHDNLSKLNNLDNTDAETISAFCFRLYRLFRCLCFTRRRWLCDFPPK